MKPAKSRGTSYEEMRVAWSKDRRERVLLGIAASACIAVPLFAKHALDHKVHVELAGAASDLVGIPVELGDTRVGLTGTLEISDVRVGEFLSAKRLVAAVSPARVGSDGLLANEILVESPHAHVIVNEDGSSNLDQLLERREESLSQAGRGAAPPSSRLERVRLVDGQLSVDLVGYGQIISSDVSMQMEGNQVHAVAGKSEIQMHKGEFQLSGVVPRAAIDYERHGDGLRRFLADGGAFRISGPGGRAIMQELAVSNVPGDEGWHLRGRSGIDRPTGNISVQLHPTLDGGNLEFHSENAPLFWAAPWLPQGVHARESTVSGDLDLSLSDKLTALASLTFSGLVVEDEALAKRPVELDLAIDAKGSLRRDGGVYLGEILIDSLKSADLSLEGHLSGQWTGRSQLPELATVSLQLHKVSCDAALSALPVALRPSLAGLELRGQMQSSLKLFMSREDSRDTNLQVHSGIEGCQAVREPPAADTQSLLAEYEHRSPDGRPHLLVKGSPGFTSYSELPAFVPETFVAAEDARFFVHDGFDSTQIERSLAIDVHTGRFARGGSTISQQLIKNLFLHRQRSLARKLQEAILTWRLEKNVSKERILEVYLNIIELGDEHTYGITEAAQRWFGVSPASLSIVQTAFLAALTPEPTSMSARIRNAGGLDEVSAARVATILRVMKRAKIITPREYQKARTASLHFASSALAWRSPKQGAP